MHAICRYGQRRRLFYKGVILHYLCPSTEETLPERKSYFSSVESGRRPVEILSSNVCNEGPCPPSSEKKNRPRIFLKNFKLIPAPQEPMS